jgi:hypothetical protein
MHEMYGLYHSKSVGFKGVTQKDTANEVSLSSIPKDLKPLAVMSFNKSGLPIVKNIGNTGIGLKRETIHDMRIQYLMERITILKT